MTTRQSSSPGLLALPFLGAVAVAFYLTPSDAPPVMPPEVSPPRAAAAPPPARARAAAPAPARTQVARAPARVAGATSAPAPASPAPPAAITPRAPAPATSGPPGKPPASVLSSLASRASPAPEIDPRITALRRTLEERGARVEGLLATRRGHAHTLRGELSAPSPDAAPIDAARAFLRENRDVLHLPEAAENLVHSRTVSTGMGEVVRFQLHFEGLPLVPGDVVVLLDEENRVRFTTRPPADEGEPGSLTLALPAEEAIRVAHAAVGPRPAKAAPLHRAIATRAGNAIVAAHEVILPVTSPPEEWRVVVDDAGEVLSKEDILVAASGRVFDPNPVKVTGDTTLVDDDDSASAVPESAYTTVPLLGLDPGGYLVGEFVDTTTTTTPIQELTEEFHYDRSHPGFEQVMSYYHLDSLQRYIQSLGIFNVNNEPQVIDPRDGEFHNAFFSFTFDEIRMGTLGVDSAEDAEVLWHEYGHAIHHDQVPGWGAGGDAGAMGEGFSDFIGAVMSRRNFPGGDAACHADWFRIEDATEVFPCGRRLDGDKVYPDDLVAQVHADGEIWSSFLWELHEDTFSTPDEVVRLVLEHHFLLGPDATMPQAAEALLAADLMLFSGKYTPAIARAAATRGFFEGYGDLTPPTLDTPTWAALPSADDAANTITMTANTYSDPNGVEYYFEELNGTFGGDDSGWVSSPTYVDAGVGTGVVWRYRFKVRDLSSNLNESPWSEEIEVVSGITGGEDTYEDDDTSGTAQFVGSLTSTPITQTHSMVTTDDVDWVRFSNVFDGKYALLEVTGTSRAVAVTLYDDSLTPLVEVDSTGEGNGATILTTIANTTHYLSVAVPPGEPAVKTYRLQMQRLDAAAPTFSDWEVTDVRAPPTAQPGVPFAVARELANVGSPDQNVVTERFVLSTDTTIDPADPILAEFLTIDRGDGDFPAFSTPVTLPATTTPGTYYIGAVVDPENDYSAEPDGNNTALVPIEVLAPDAFENDDTAPGPERFLPILSEARTLHTSTDVDWFYFLLSEPSHLTVITTGSQADPFVALYDNVYNLVTFSDDEGPGANTYLEARHLPTGYYVLAFALPGSTVPPASYRLTVLGDPTQGIRYQDLAVTRIEGTNLVPQGGRMTIDRDIENLGIDDLPGSYKERLYLSPDADIGPGDTLISSNTRSALDGGEKVTLNFSYNLPTIPPGSYYLGSFVDADEEWAELSEANNVGVAPELVVVPITVAGGTNTDFETGDLSGWTVSSGGSFPMVQTTTVFDGTHAAYLGDGASGMGPENLASISQDFYIPADAQGARLYVTWRIDGSDVGNDRMRFKINGSQIDQKDSSPGGWRISFYDLSAHIGSNITVTIEVTTDTATNPVHYYVDDIRMMYWVGPPFEEIPVTLAVQGRLETTTGTAVTDPVTLATDLFPEVSGALPAVASEVDVVTPDADGVFVADLGEASSLPTTAFGHPLFAELAVDTGGGSVAMAPRLPLLAAPHALKTRGVRFPVTTFPNGTHDLDQEVFVLCDTTGGPVTLDLPDPVQNPGRQVLVRRSVGGQACDVRDDTETFLATAGSSASRFVSDGTAWRLAP